MSTEQQPAAANADRREVLIQSRIFFAIGGAVAVMAAIYIATAYEDTGSVMLVLAAGLSLICGGYLFVQLRRPEAEVDRSAHDGSPYLPHASIWPFWMGLAGFLIANGLILGTWFLVPGGLLLVIALTGFISQSRTRS